MRHKILVGAIAIAMSMLMLGTTVSNALAANRIFDLYLQNLTQFPVTFTVVPDGASCLDSPVPGTVLGPIEPNQDIPITLARVQGHGCDGQNGKFGIKPDTGLGDVQRFEFDNQGNLAMTSTPTHFIGDLTPKSSVDETYGWTMSPVNPLQVTSRTNVAQGKPATQSSTIADPCNPIAAKAVDGNTSGTFSACSVSHTNTDPQAWWRVDLQDVYWIDTIDVWNRTDCCSDRLSNFSVLVSPDGKYFRQYDFSGAAASPTTLKINARGRFVQVQLKGTNALHMAEVQVWPVVIHEDQSGTVLLKHASTGLNLNQAYLGDPGKDKKDRSAGIGIEADNDAAKWLFESSSAGSNDKFILNKGTGLVLTANTQNGTVALDTRRVPNDPAQLWTLRSVPPGGGPFYITNKATQSELTVVNASRVAVSPNPSGEGREFVWAVQGTGPAAMKKMTLESIKAVKVSTGQDSNTKWLFKGIDMAVEAGIGVATGGGAPTILGTAKKALFKQGFKAAGNVLTKAGFKAIAKEIVKGKIKSKLKSEAKDAMIEAATGRSDYDSVSEAAFNELYGESPDDFYIELNGHQVYPQGGYYVSMKSQQTIQPGIVYVFERSKGVSIELFDWDSASHDDSLGFVAFTIPPGTGTQRFEDVIVREPSEGSLYLITFRIEDYGNLKAPTDTFDSSATTSNAVGAFTQVSAGGSHSCVISSADGTVSCFGENDKGQSTPPAGRFIQISAGTNHSCGVKQDGTVACWGDDSKGQASPPSGTFKMVSAGYVHTCGIKTDGTVVCWGSNDFDQTRSPAGTFIDLEAGSSHTCGIKTDGTLACWGRNNDGQLDSPGGQFKQVTSGDRHSCGMKTDGNVVCWGQQVSGIVEAPKGAFKQISAGDIHTCGLKPDSTVLCWGSGALGQTTVPPGAYNFISAGGAHTCGIKTDGTMVCWSDNSKGQLGAYSAVSAVPPTNTPAASVQPTTAPRVPTTSPVTGVNLAAARNGGKVVAASSNYGAGWEQDKLIDENPGTSWATAANQTTNQYIIVKLAFDGMVPIKRVRLNPSANGGDGPENNLKDWDLRGSNTFDPATFDPATFDPATFDPATFSMIASFGTQRQVPSYEFDIPDVSARYVLLLGKDNFGGANLEVAELEVYGAARELTFPAGPAPTATTVTSGSGDWQFCANEHETCTFVGTKTVRFGANGNYATLTATDSIECSNAVFGDPAPNVEKHCDYK